MTAFPDDVFTEPEPDDDTLANLGPLRALAGSFAGTKGRDRHPNEGGVGEDDHTDRGLVTRTAPPVPNRSAPPQLTPSA